MPRRRLRSTGRLRAATYGLIFLALGGYLLTSNAMDLYHSARVLVDDVAVPGSVTKVHHVHNHRSPDDFYVAVRFDDRSGGEHRFESRHSYTWWSVPDAGSRVTVRYRKGDPDLAVEGSLWHLLPAPFAWCLGGLGILGLAFDEFRQALVGDEGLA